MNGKRQKQRYWIVKVNRCDVRVLAKDKREARQKARDGRGRLVGVYY